MAQVCKAERNEMRRRVVTEAMSWIGTPYRHQASIRYVGADCLGVIRGVWRELCGPEPMKLPAYSDDWLDTRQSDHVADAISDLFEPGPAQVPCAGQVLVFGFGRKKRSKHLGILTSTGDMPRFVHAYTRFGVVETSLDPAWQRRVAGVFDFPLGAFQSWRL